MKKLEVIILMVILMLPLVMAEDNQTVSHQQDTITDKLLGNLVKPFSIGSEIANKIIGFLFAIIWFPIRFIRFIFELIFQIYTDIFLFFFSLGLAFLLKYLKQKNFLINTKIGFLILWLLVFTTLKLV